MDKKLAFDRRQFVQGSMALLGANTFAGLVKPEAASGPNNGNPRMQAAFEPKQGVWILVEPAAGFKEQLAARELARGLRNLGFAREPKQAETVGAEAETS